MNNFDISQQDIQDPNSILQQFLEAYFSGQNDNMKTMLIEGIDLVSFFQLRSKYFSKLPNNIDIIKNDNVPILDAAILTNSPTIIDYVITICNIQDLEINLTDSDHTTTCLTLATSCGFLETVQHLIQKYNVQTNGRISTDERSNSLLFEAMWKNHSELVLYLEPLCPKMSQETLHFFLQKVVEQGNLPILQHFKTLYNVELNTVVDPYTKNNLLHIALQSTNDIELIKYLINNGVNVHAINSSNVYIYPISNAISTRKWDLMKYLINECNVDIQIEANRKYSLPSIVSDPNMTPELFDELMALGFDRFDHFGSLDGVGRMFDDDDDYRPPVLFDARNLTMIKHLINKYKVNCHAVGRWHETLYYLFLQMGEKCTVEMIQYCYDLGININPPNLLMFEPLSLATARLCSDDVLNKLIECGAKITLMQCWTIIQLTHNTNFVDICITKLGDEITPDWLSMVMCCIISNKNDIMFNHFVSKGYLNLNYCTDPGDTYLHLAVKSGWIEIVQYLLSTNHKFQSTTKDHPTPLDYAIQLSDDKYNIDMVKLLIQHGYHLSCNNLFQSISKRRQCYSVIQLLDIFYQNGTFSYKNIKFQQPTLMQFLQHYIRPTSRFHTFYEHILLRTLIHSYQLHYFHQDDQISPLHYLATIHRTDLMYYVLYYYKEDGQMIDFGYQNQNKRTFLHEFLLTSEPNNLNFHMLDQSHDIEAVIDLIAQF